MTFTIDKVTPDTLRAKADELLRLAERLEDMEQSGRYAIGVVRQVIEKAGQFYGVVPLRILSRRRDPHTVAARQVAFYLALSCTRLSTTITGRLIGDRDHATVIHGRNVIEKRMAEQPAFAAAINKLKAEIMQSTKRAVEAVA